MGAVRTWTGFGLTLALGMACRVPTVATAKQDSSPVFDAPTSCATVKAWADCLQGHEQRQLEKHHSRATRDGRALRLALKSGTQLVLEDVATPEDESTNYHFQDYLSDLGLYVVFVRFYEDWEWWIVEERSGKKLSFVGSPLLSPDRKHLAAGGLSKCKDTEELALIAVERGELRVAWSLKVGSRSWGLSKPRWLNEATLELKRVECEHMGAGEGEKLLLRHDPAGWQLESTAGKPIPSPR